MVSGLHGTLGKPAVNLAAVESSNACAVVQIQDLKMAASTAMDEASKQDNVTKHLVELVRYKRIFYFTLLA
jgi:hypothetical protein